ncbi:MAG: hypothetical protein LUH22_19820 [Bacteroides sp.]|nr:hypothetical protein [Bacteroides sp.]
MKANMKNSSLILFLIVGICMSCGSGSGNKYVENEALGIFPSIFVELHKELQRQKEEYAGNSVSNEMDLMELNRKWSEAEEKAKKDALTAATQEIGRLAEKTVPFECDYEDPDFEVRSAMIEDGDTTTGALTISLVIGAKHAMEASTKANLHYLIIDKAGNAIGAGTINPFVSTQIITNRTFPHRQKIAEGNVCCWQGSKLMLYCGSYDYTNFSHILFTDKK